MTHVHLIRKRNVMQQSSQSPTLEDYARPCGAPVLQAGRVYRRCESPKMSLSASKTLQYRLERLLRRLGVPGSYCLLGESTPSSLTSDQ